MTDLVRVQVLIPKTEADRFAAYCREKGFKKSPLIARLIREHLDAEAFHPQSDLFEKEKQEPQEL
jgi:hypothetical protein